MHIHIEQQGRRHYLIGDTYPIRDQLRSAGCRYLPPSRRTWTLHGVIYEYAEAAQDLPIAVVRRQAGQDSGEAVYVVGGRVVCADECPDVEIVAGPITHSEWDVPLPLCPDCGGDLVWWEAGYVPGTRRCGACGSLFCLASQ